MKLSIIALLLLNTSSAITVRGDDIWGEAMDGINQDEYNKATPKPYKEADKPKPKKIDYEAMYKK